ncbi:MAG: hypothetical protein GEEBNDBF_02349 [bacterium]|nr:hypothetical protein [bacterium]
MPISTARTRLCRLRGYAVPDTPEEAVRQQVIGELLRLGYPWHLLRCEVGHPVLGQAAGRADLVIGLTDEAAGGTAWGIVECKAHPPGPADVAQVLAYARAFRAACWGVTDGTRWQVWQRAHPNDVGHVWPSMEASAAALSVLS